MFNADRLAGKDLAEVNLFAAHADAAKPGHDNDLVVKAAPSHSAPRKHGYSTQVPSRVSGCPLRE